MLKDVVAKSEKVKLLKSPGNYIINSEEESAHCRLRAFSNPKSFTHQIILQSLNKNSLESSFNEKISEKLNKKNKGRVDNNPILHIFELYGPTPDGNYSYWYLISDEVQLCTKSLVEIKMFNEGRYGVSFDKTMQEFLRHKIA